MLQNIISRIEPWPNLHDLPPILLNIRHPPVSLVGGWLPWSTWQPCHGHQAELVILAQLHRVLGERWANTYTIHPIQLGPSLTFFLECLKKNSNGLVQICIGKNLCFPIFPSIVPLLKWHSLHPWSWAWNRNSLEVRFRSWVICRFPAVNLPGYRYITYITSLSSSKYHESSKVASCRSTANFERNPAKRAHGRFPMCFDKLKVGCSFPESQLGPFEDLAETSEFLSPYKGRMCTFSCHSDQGIRFM